MNIPLDGTAYDSVTHTTGTIHNAVAASDHHSQAGKAMMFNRADSSYIDFGDLDNASFTGNVFTISCWINVTDTSGQSLSVLSKRTPVGPYEYSLDNHFSHTVFDLDNWTAGGGTSIYGIDPLKASVPVQLNAWQHIAYVADSVSLKVYVNGTLQSGSDLYVQGLSFANTSAPLVIGDGGAFGKHLFFNGSIDDIRMYSRALDAKAVSYLSTL
ncbi:MAG: WD40-like repeat protein [Bacteroidota bacterium]|nr:WD40-like repeat protein [Bacteroidota bacterium]